MEIRPHKIEQPPADRIRAFLQRTKQSIQERRAIRQEQITALVGQSSSPEDLDAAESLIEDGVLNDPQSGRTAREQGLIAFIPPRGDKFAMVGLETGDPDVYELFNRAANRVTRDLGGFHQIGSNKTDGYTAWELWKLGGKKSYTVVEEVYEQMREISGVPE